MNTKKIVLNILIVFLLSCSNHAGKSGNIAQSQKSQHGDSINSTEENDEPTDEELFKCAYSNLLNSYKHNQKIDTLFVIGKDSFEVNATCICLNDGKVIIPKRYVQPYLNKDFITHNFVLHIVVHKNKTLYIEKKLLKENFYKYMDKDYETMRNYCTLTFSGLRAEGESILVYVSIGVPLTDVGVGLADTIKSNSLKL